MTTEYIEEYFIEQETLRNDNIDNGHHYCEMCSLYNFKSGCGAFDPSVFNHRMKFGDQLLSRNMGMLEITNMITVEFPCNNYIEKIKKNSEQLQC